MRRGMIVFILTFSFLSIASGCDPILEQRQKNGLELKPFAPREYIRVRRPRTNRDMVQELETWTKMTEQVDQAVLLKRHRNVYVGVLPALPSQEIAEETVESIQGLLADWICHPEVERIFVTYRIDQVKRLMDDPDLPEEQLARYDWILLRSS